MLSHRLSKTAAAVLMGLASSMAFAEITDYSAVTQDRLENPEAENWLMWRGNYEGWGYSPLDQVNQQNVSDLKLAWTVSTGVVEGHQAPPIVNNGVMYVATPMNQVMALDAKTGDIHWRYQREIPEELFQLHPTSRGVGLWNDKVYLAATDCTLVALDAKTGEVAWEAAVDDWTKGYYMTLAPFTAEGLVIVGSSGGEYGIRGWITAYDAETGEEKWRTHTIPGPGEPGHDTWAGDSWKTGGASAWVTGNYNADTKTLYWGIGNAAPWMPDTRPGDNLYANSVMALDVTTGAIKGHHQYHWNEAWDWDEVSPPILMPVVRDGKTIDKALVNAARNGYLWVLESQDDGQIKFHDAEPYVRQNVFTSIDPETGRPTYDPDKVPGIGKEVAFCPSLWGGKDWPPGAYSPKTGMLYLPTNNNLCGSLKGKDETYNPGQLFLGSEIADIKLFPDEEGGDWIGEIQAWDMNTRKNNWTHTFEWHNWGPLLVTGGDVIFAGGTNDRAFRAFNASTGEVLWEHATSSGITAPASTYMIDGKQYVAVASGWGVDAQRKQDALAPYKGKMDVPQGGSIWVFALD